MNSTEVIALARESVIVMLLIGGPILMIALGVGLVISLIQALTQVQEMTLTFVPKILVIFVAILVLLPFMLSTLTTFTHGLFDRIVAGG
ncbi:MAG TPA: flagellar biosynthesis protein FliQ [Alphaproteobacteria bacterium]|nr:flagellar biosynthesis protein FliQ [Alphaproteobacteria bacterium]